jgi:hypothetical protein
LTLYLSVAELRAALETFSEPDHIRVVD